MNMTERTQSVAMGSNDADPSPPDQQQNTRVDNTSSAAAVPNEPPSLPRIGNMSIVLPFSSHAQIHEPRQESHAELSDSTFEETAADQAHLAPKPLAVKPAYRKRVVVPATRDGIIRKTGFMAAKEKLERSTLDRQARSGRNIYDRPDLVHLSALTSVPQQQRQRQPNPSKSLLKRKAPAKQKPSIKKKQKRAPEVWRPTIPTSPSASQHASRPNAQSKLPGLVPPVSREGQIETLLKLQDVHKERLAQLAARPLPLRDLQTLIQADLEQEELILSEIGVILHKEFLKLQLEEGVLLNMLYSSKSGSLNALDLQRLRPLGKPTKKNAREKVAVTAGLRGRVGTGAIAGAMAMTGATATTRTAYRMEAHPDVSTRADGLQEVSPGGTLDEAENTETGRDKDHVGEYDGIDNDEDEDREEQEDSDRGVDGGMESSMPIYHLPGESYSLRPVASSSQSQPDTVGRPGASLAQPSNPQDDARKRFVDRDNTKASQNTSDIAVAGWDEGSQTPYEAEYDDDENDAEGNVEGDDDAMYPESESEYGDDSEDEGEESDDETARVALQQMLAQYGAGPP